jgi:hypothetical protein
MAPFTRLDSRVHHRVLQSIVDRGAAPTVAELAADLDHGADDIAASLARLHDNHGLVLHPGGDSIWIAHPFSLSPTAVWVARGDRGWWAPCLWCAFGIQALVGAVDITVRLGGEAETVVVTADGDTITVDAGAGCPPIDGELIAHFPLPPRRAWDNVSHFCAQLLPFRSLDQLDAWCARHRLPRGVALAPGQLQQLAFRWYGRHLDDDWVKWTPAEAAAIFAGCGLDGDFWALDASADRF